MRKLIILVFCILSTQSYAQFDQWFSDKSLRMDFYHSGDKHSDFYTFDEFIQEDYWAGSKVNMIDEMNYGMYYLKVKDAHSKKLIYSRGYSTLFGEWKTTNEATKVQRTMSETVILPYPKHNVIIEIYQRNKKGKFEKKFEHLFDTNNYFVSHEKRLAYPSFDVHISGTASKMIDVLILPEGYTKDEMGKFIDDCQNFKDALFMFEPYKKNKDKFNIRGILAPSNESGADVPADTIWRNTQMDVSFYTFDLERYCMTDANKSIRDLASNAAYDQIYILVNSKKYGGGAIFNHYSSSVSGNSFSAKIIVHEFGHAFAGLGDEYYTSAVAYNEFYPLDVEPWEPNLTTLVDFDKKWSHLTPPGTPIPTPATEPYIGKIGVFEGGGYVFKGVFRPSHQCLMNAFDTETFCATCQEAIQRMIDFYSE